MCGFRVSYSTFVEESFICEQSICAENLLAQAQ
jgi:hypothetical protein